MINFVTLNQIHKVYDKEDTRRETFIAEDDGIFLACDNRDGNIKLETFYTLWGAIKWCAIKGSNAETIRKTETVQKAFKRQINLSI